MARVYSPSTVVSTFIIFPIGKHMSMIKPDLHLLTLLIGGILGVAVPSRCVQPVIKIRHRLGDELGKLDGHNSELATTLLAMRAACRKFL